MYTCLTKNSFKNQDDYQLVTIRQEDMELIRLWRNAQMDVLRQKALISPQEQHTYFQKLIGPTFIQAQPKQILFSFLIQQECIGYGGLTNIEWEALHAEVSFLVDPFRAKDSSIYRKDHSHFLALLCQVAFQELHLHRLFTETFAFRVEHIKTLENFGFKKEGILKEHIFKHNQWHDSVLHGLLCKEWEHAQ